MGSGKVVILGIILSLHCNWCVVLFALPCDIFDSLVSHSLVYLLYLHVFMVYCILFIINRNLIFNFCSTILRALEASHIIFLLLFFSPNSTIYFIFQHTFSALEAASYSFLLILFSTQPFISKNLFLTFFSSLSLSLLQVTT